jgi:hypothetical protein
VATFARVSSDFIGLFAFIREDACLRFVSAIVVELCFAIHSLEQITWPCFTARLKRFPLIVTFFPQTLQGNIAVFIDFALLCDV